METTTPQSGPTTETATATTTTTTTTASSTSNDLVSFVMARRVALLRSHTQMVTGAESALEAGFSETTCTYAKILMRKWMTSVDNCFAKNIGGRWKILSHPNPFPKRNWKLTLNLNLNLNRKRDPPFLNPKTDLTTTITKERTKEQTVVSGRATTLRLHLTWCCSSPISLLVFANFGFSRFLFFLTRKLEWWILSTLVQQAYA